MIEVKSITDKNPRYAIGLMSGTSADGVDAALVRLKGTGPSLAMKLIHHETFPYAPSLKTRLLNEHLSAKDVCLLNFELGEEFAEASLAMIKASIEEDLEVDFIASHGHTVAHHPPPTNNPAGSLQIGESAIIAERTGITVVSDFRPRDMAAGGQGAPLVPYADWVLFRAMKRPVACLNIGGIANFTAVVPKLDNMLAFDTGPGNMIIDGAVRLLTRGAKDYDKNGRAASKGVVIDEFLSYLLSHEFFSKVPPKSTGREDFGAEVYLRDALASRREHSYDDLIATVTKAVSSSIITAFNRFIKPEFDIEEIVVAGGGAMNNTLIEWIDEGLPECTVYTSEQYGIPNSAREAIAFAILGNETLHATPNNIPQATGANGSVVLGKVTPA
jgi:anhydro-N-acetylmuramic acid kinase